jgi:hypothetical protein
MKTIALILIGASLGLAQNSQETASRPVATRKTTQQNGQKATAAGPKKPAPAPQAVTSIPDGAKLVEPNTYRFTDSNGKTWMYKQTPFGISRWEDVPTPASQPAASEPTTITDLGDSFRFERKTAFGPSQWVRKKSELTQEEKALVASQHDEPASAATAKKSERQ